MATPATADAAVYTHLERRLYSALTALGVEFVPQHPAGYYTLDAYLPAYGLAIEVDGCDWHGCLLCGWDTPYDRYQRQRDRTRDRRLLMCHSIATIRIAGHSMNNDEQAHQSVRAALTQAGVLPAEHREEQPV